MPGNVGGADWGGAGVDPATGMLFVPSLTSPIVDQLVKGDPARGNMRYRRGGAQQSADARRPAALQAAVQPRHRLRSEHRHHRLAGAARRRTARASVAEGSAISGPLGAGTRGTPLVTATLLFVSQLVGRAGTRREPEGWRPDAVDNSNPEPPNSARSTSATGDLVWETELPVGPAAAPMTYSYRGSQYIVLAIGGGVEAELVAYALPPA